MTVCVAAICWGGDTIIGASDRMITSPDIQFEPATSKSIQLTNSMVAMIAGDANVQAEILNIARPEINRRINASAPGEWLTVAEIAQLWAQIYSEIRFREAENVILRPLGLDRTTYYSKQHEMKGEFISEIGSQLLQFQIAEVVAIIAGVDGAGAHIYLAQNERSFSQDRIGFAAIGSGSRHANSQMMFRGHTQSEHFAEALLSVYMSKRRADEVAPGVGEDSDLFMIGPGPGRFGPIPGDFLSRVTDEYTRLRTDEDRAMADAERRMSEYAKQWFEEMAKEPEPEQEAAPEGAKEGAGAAEANGRAETEEDGQSEIEH